MTDETQQPTVTITADTSRFNEAYEMLLDKMPPRDQWLAKIRSNPSDWQAMLVFADWLEEEGDLLAAEQWRWIAAVSLNLMAFGRTEPLAEWWPSHVHFEQHGDLFPHETLLAIKHNIRCMPTYPLTIEDVQAYLETA